MGLQKLSIKSARPINVNIFDSVSACAIGTSNDRILQLRKSLPQPFAAASADDPKAGISLPSTRFCIHPRNRTNFNSSCKK